MHWLSFLLSWSPLPYIVISILIILFLISIFGNIGIDWKEKKFTFGRSKRRSCSDCIRILMAKRTQFDTLYYNKQKNILRSQMIFVEHKITDIEIIISKEIHVSFKDEIRRSFKENGFADLTEKDFKNYIDERIEILTSKLNYSNPKINEIIKEIYISARNIARRLESELKKLEEDFCKEIDNFVKEVSK